MANLRGTGRGWTPGRVERRRIKAVAVGCAVGGAAAVASAAWSGPVRTPQQADKRLLLPATCVECVAGAVGELAQILLLYPLDTIKVRCQANGLAARHVVAELLAGGVNLSLLKTLYAGALGAAICSIGIGAIHFASFETSRRMLVTRLPGGSNSCTSSSSSSSNNSSSSSSSSQDTSCTSSSSSSRNGSWEGHGINSAAVPVAVASCSSSTSTQPADGDGEVPGLHSPQLAANILAAMFAAFATAVFESPVELFRHNQQAGLFQGSFLKEMVRTVRAEGVIRGLYWGFLPHCFEAWPHDVSELLVAGSMKDFHSDALHPVSQHHWWMHRTPLHMWDSVSGAAAGAAAVLISMPFDTIKTYMQTHGTDLSGKGVLGSARLFLRTGQKLVLRRGPGALYLGVMPRLLQQVPSAMVGWTAIHACQRAMLPYTHMPSPTSTATTALAAAGASSAQSEDCATGRSG